VFIREMNVAMLVAAGPDWSRLRQASSELSKAPSADGISRVALSPSWWQLPQPFNWTAFNHCSCVW
jgi:hypothetical protein